MATQKSDSPELVSVPKPNPAARSEALEAELAMLETMLPPEAERSAERTRVEPAKDRGGAK